MAKVDLVVVTGAAGFIGSHLCDALLAKGYRVRGADDMSAGEHSNLESARAHDGFEFHQADVSDLDVCRKLCAGATAVLHEAAQSSVPASVEAPERAHKDTCTSTLHMLTAAREAGARRFLLAASAACYSEQAPQPLVEKTLLWPLSPYAAAKIASEQYVKAFAGMGLDGVCLRYFNVYGPRHSAKSSYANVIPAFTRRILDGGEITVYGDGEQTRDFVHVSDVVRANLLALEREKPLGGISINIATGHSTSINALAHSIAKACGRELELKHQDVRAGDFKHSLADVSLAKSELGFEAQVGLDAGIASVVEWMKQA
ncbi:MAG: NAD-dependent epimerase/dehydratase family protein [Planctomycetes bacterium]|nr:NAD-dependent epimerase/dehydratase family protein [Planctomycetota bacterium]